MHVRQRDESATKLADIERLTRPANLEASVTACWLRDLIANDELWLRVAQSTLASLWNWYLYFILVSPRSIKSLKRS